jgi:hypothetical protein
MLGPCGTTVETVFLLFHVPGRRMWSESTPFFARMVPEVLARVWGLGGKTLVDPRLVGVLTIS